MRIKLAADADLAMLQHIYDERIALLRQGDRRIRPAPVQWLDRIDGCVWVGEVENKVAGYISAQWPDSLWIIDHMGLDAHTYYPGLARALVSAVCDTARTRGSREILVCVPSYDPVEQAFWRSLGAKDDRHRPAPGYQWMRFAL
jgi:ribosomal protein S18 acetylase RimI-like enzyme